MSDGSNQNPPNQPPHDKGSNDDLSASNIFLEMMRQKASQQPVDQPHVTESHPTDAQFPDENTPPVDQPADAPSQVDQAPVRRPAQASPLSPQQKEARRQRAREKLRIERVQRRRRRRRNRAFGVFGGFMRTLFVVGITASLTATIFTWWTRPEFLAPSVSDSLSLAIATATSQGRVLQPTALPATPNWLKRIGIVSGHRGPENDPGAVCPDGLTEASINLNVAQIVVRNLQARGYTVDLLDEFDPRLTDYQAEVLVSIHANTCQDYGEVVTGYLISTADSRAASGNDQLLVECVASHYQQSSQLDRRTGLTRDMTDYHLFREIDSLTPAVIVELGFMFSDREILTTQPDLLARGITNGILCFLEPGDVNILATLQAPTPDPIIPTPTLTPTPETVAETTQ